MRYKELMTRNFGQQYHSKTRLAVGLLAGLAAGAALAILFAPKGGSDVRRSIGDKVMGLGQDVKDIYASLMNRINGGNSMGEAASNPENYHNNHKGGKKPKSDIKELIHEAHAGGHAHTEQGLG